MKHATHVPKPIRVINLQIKRNAMIRKGTPISAMAPRGIKCNTQ